DLASIRFMTERPDFIAALTGVNIYHLSSGEITSVGMTNVCPQCKFPIPREGSRFCNQCGTDLRAVDSGDLKSVEMQDTLDEGVSPISAVAQTFPERSGPDIPAKMNMTASQDTKPQTSSP